MREVPEFIRGRRGGEQMILAGFSYTKNQIRKKSVVWECCERSCRAIALTDKHYAIKTIPTHNHVADADKCNAKRIRSQLVTV